MMILLLAKDKLEILANFFNGQKHFYLYMVDYIY